MQSCKYIRHLVAGLVLLCAAWSSAKAQSEDDKAVKAVVTSLFDGMRKTDTAVLRSCFAPSAHLETILKSQDGIIKVVMEETEVFVENVSRPHKQVYDERITFESVKIDGDLAMVWAPYKFYLDDKFSHCGVDMFCMVRLNKEWKIQYLIDTRRFDACP